MPNLMQGDKSVAAFFFYIEPSKHKNLVRKFVGPVSHKEITQIPQIGSSPAFISVQDFRRVATLWFNTTVTISNDAEAHKAWGWILEMYGYSLATYRAGVHQGLDVNKDMLAEPPFDTKLTGTPSGRAFTSCTSRTPSATISMATSHRKSRRCSGCLTSAHTWTAHHPGASPTPPRS